MSELTVARNAIPRFSSTTHGPTSRYIAVSNLVRLGLDYVSLSSYQRTGVRRRTT
jgi:hypothetical protein